MDAKLRGGDDQGRGTRVLSTVGKTQCRQRDEWASVAEMAERATGKLRKRQKNMSAQAETLIAPLS